jgi:DNA-binding transcriptional regulator YhcF (GntR family)
VILEIDARSAMPPYEQIREQITTLVRGGVLAEGVRLPPIRQLANDLGLAGGTVARAYRELESDGVVTTRGRHGTVVAGLPRNQPAPAPELTSAAARFAGEIHRIGAREDDAISALRAALAAARNG